MTLKTNTIIGLIFLGLLAFVYFYEIKGGEERRKEAEKSKRLVDFKDGEVLRIELVRGDSALVLTRGVEGWKLNSPVVDGADQDAVERYLRNLQESEREKTIVDSAAVTDSEVVKYGLDTPRSSFPAKINVPEEITHFGRKCLVARRLLERGVRFVQIWSGCDNGFPRRNWDSHEDISRDHGPLAEGMAVGTAGLIADLKQRGLLDDTIILWTTEFGRMPSTQGTKGRDHNPYVFTNWLAGGGIKGGTTYGPSDQWGYKPADRDNPTHVYDIHATILHLLGIDHEQLTVRHNGIDRRLTDVHGHVIHDIIA